MAQLNKGVLPAVGSVIAEWTGGYGTGSISGVAADKGIAVNNGAELYFAATTASGTFRLTQNTNYGTTRVYCPLLPGSRGNLTGSGAAGTATVDWDRPWRVSWVGTHHVGDNGNSQSLLFGVNYNHAATTLSGKGVRIQWASTGTGAAATTISIVAHNGSSETTGATTSTIAADRWSLDEYVLEWTPSVGFSLYRNGTLAAQLTSGLPSGTGTAGSISVGVVVAHVNVANSLASVFSATCMRAAW